MADAKGFWSYAHDDDAADEGRIRALAERLAAEYALITGSSIDIFVDRSAIKWGDEWRRTIDTALSETAFFMPVITPRYFTRPECRRELLDFYGAATSLGLGQLILPVRYVTVQDLTDDNPDDVIAIVSKMQYVDWTNLRIEGPSSPESRKAVNEMAVRLAALVQEVDQIQMRREVVLAQEEPEAQESSGLAEVLSEIDRLLPEWLAAVTDERVTSAQYIATEAEYGRRMEKLIASGATRGARLSLLYRQAGYELPLGQQRLDHAKVYAAKTTELDPLVTRAIRIVEAHPDVRPMLGSLVEAVGEARDAMAEALEYAKGMDPRYGNAEFWRDNAHLGKTAKAVADVYAEGDRFVREANLTVLRWAGQLGMPVEGLDVNLT